MKFTVAIFAVLAIAGPLSAYKLPSTGSGQLAKDLQDIMDLIPFDEVFDVTRAYIAQDRDTQLMLELVESPNSKEVVRYVENAAAIKKVLAFVEENGLDIYYLINKYNEYMDMSPIEPSVALRREIIGGIDGYYMDIAKVLPIQDLTTAVENKLETSKLLNELVALAGSNEVLDVLKNCRSSEPYMKLEKQAEENGLGFVNFDKFFPYYLMILPAVKHTF